jgi:hypothetical protein
MMGSFYPIVSDSVQSRWRVARIVGNGTGTPTIALGAGFTMSRVSAGDYKMTFTENPGVYCGAGMDLQAATPSGLAGFTVVVKDYDATNFVVEFVIYNTSQAATDLTSSQSVNVLALFKQSNL